MCAEVTPLSHCALNINPEKPVAIHNGRLIDRHRFNSEVADHASELVSLPQQHFALYYQAAYPFAVLFFALLHAGKHVWIAGNNRSDTAEKLIQQGCRLLGEWQGREILPKPCSKEIKLKALDLRQAQITIFTSGSSGQPKAISKSLAQLQCEIETLENLWGAMLGQAQALATVSHQHIYGLLFRLLWPLASGRCFHSTLYLSPEPLLKKISDIPSYWVASPAQLKRLDDLTPWDEITRLTAIFSSGGALNFSFAKQIQQYAGQKVLEIYGSSETGGIAWREPVTDECWIPFAGIDFILDNQVCPKIISPYLRTKDPFPLDDTIELQSDGRFMLSGRMDRIVKVEEKRLSLNEMELELCKSNLVEQAYTLLLADKRDRIAAVVVLAPTGNEFLKHSGKAALIKQLREPLMQVFENVVLPRKWLFMEGLPVTAQGKIDNAMLALLLTLEASKFPRILYCDLQHNQVKLSLRIQEELVYFVGHFPGQPILPGVTQLAWVEHYGKIFFAIDQPFLTMEVIKFKKIIQPDARVTMTLEWKAEAGKLYFDLASNGVSHSSGRMVYGAHV